MHKSFKVHADYQGNKIIYLMEMLNPLSVIKSLINILCDRNKEK